ncbi:hypothetical protein AQ956_00225 [Burkholderia pseudomallei]|nr:hypothetical protein AQ841_09285 [Burkholderia pseudomallei]ONE86947.1 hypothetical protein AQ956_00225 [Burkholderia pseudomallei]OSO81028.1 hypothetical protein BOC56_30430 [Burkholderia pseudomallei]
MYFRRKQDETLPSLSNRIVGSVQHVNDELVFHRFQGLAKRGEAFVILQRRYVFEHYCFRTQDAYKPKKVAY